MDWNILLAVTVSMGIKAHRNCGQAHYRHGNDVNTSNAVRFMFSRKG